MDKIKKQEILEGAKNFFLEVIMPNHIDNLKKLSRLSEFSYNPFLLKYLATFLSGNDDPENIAKVLIYPRILGTSINTSFGQNIQKFCGEVLEGFGSAISGIDIEFTDQIDKRKKYCQIKAGPQTINKDDVETISRHFSSIKNLARTNNLNIGINDLVVALLYGTGNEISGNYKQLQKEYTLYIGKDFWHRLTGDENFYQELIDLYGELAKQAHGTELLEKVIEELSEEIRREYSK